LYSNDDETKNIHDGHGHEKLSYKERNERVVKERNNPTNVVRQELMRMHRDAPFDNLFPFLCKPSDSVTNEYNLDNSCSFMFHNVRGLRKNLKYINSDYAVENAQYIMFVECHTHENNMDNFNIKGHKLKHCTIGQDANSKHGMALFAPTTCVDISMVACNSTMTVFNKYKSTDRLEMVVYQHLLLDIFVCYIYNHPDNERSFFSDLFKFLAEIKQLKYDKNAKRFRSKLVVVGDFNCQYEKSSALFTKIHDEMNLFTEKTGRTTDYGTTIDYFLTNLPKTSYQLMRYESIFSDHKPFWFYVKKDVAATTQPIQASQTHSDAPPSNPLNEIHDRVSKYAILIDKMQCDGKCLDDKAYKKHIEYLQLIKNNLKEQEKCPMRKSIAAQLVYLYGKLKDIREADPIVIKAIDKKFSSYAERIDRFKMKKLVSADDIDKLDESIIKQIKILNALSGTSAIKKKLLKDANAFFSEIDKMKKLNHSS
jgi:hypothetical protein